MQVIADSDELAELEGLVAEERAAVQRVRYVIEQFQLLSTFEMLILRRQVEYLLTLLTPSRLNDRRSPLAASASPAGCAREIGYLGSG